MTTIRHWLLGDAQATRAAGEALGNALRHLRVTQPIVITLQGDLGAGKTTLVSGLLAALGYAGIVRSPTYTLIEPYELAGRACYHLDLYRLTDPLQLEELGLRDLMQADALLLIEWPEKAGDALGKVALVVQLAYLADATEGRQLKVIAQSDSMQTLLDNLVISSVAHCADT